jgi:hypothetical protein
VNVFLLQAVIDSHLVDVIQTAYLIEKLHRGTTGKLGIGNRQWAIGSRNQCKA